MEQIQPRARLLAMPAEWMVTGFAALLCVLVVGYVVAGFHGEVVVGTPSIGRIEDVQYDARAKVSRLRTSDGIYFVQGVVSCSIGTPVRLYRRQNGSGYISLETTSDQQPKTFELAK